MVLCGVNENDKRVHFATIKLGACALWSLAPRLLRPRPAHSMNEFSRWVYDLSASRICMAFGVEPVVSCGVEEGKGGQTTKIIHAGIEVTSPRAIFAASSAERPLRPPDGRRSCRPPHRR